MTQSVFAQFGADGSPILIAPFGGFTTYRKLVEDEHDSAISLGVPIGQPVPFLVNHGEGPDGWDDEQLARYCVEKVDVSDTPTGELLSEVHLSISPDGAILATPVFVDQPPPPRRELRKSLVMQRILDLGKGPAAQSLFASNFELHMKWVSPDWPNVYADDAGLLAALGAMGCTEEEVAAITAPKS